MKRITILFITVMISVFMIYGSGDGEQGRTGAQLLRLNMSARSIALGGGGIALVDHMDSMSINPAGIADLSVREIVLSHHEMFDGVRAEYVGYAQRFFGVAVGMDMRGYYFSMDEYDSAGTATGDSISVYNMAGTVGLGLPVGEYLKLGGSVSGIYEHYGYDEVNDLNWGFNVGMRADIMGGKLSIGASVRNLSTERIGFLDEENRNFPMPLLLNGGVAYRLRDDSLRNVLIICADVESYWDKKMVPSGGVEYYPKDWITLRAGYRHNEEYEELDNISFGFGISETIKNVEGRLDYAYSAYGEMGATHKITYSLIW